MIKLPNLDDQNYADIVEAAKRRISVIFPEWTDYNEHDPGITMIELFAWLKEMQQYYLNRISDNSYENMLKLLGIDVYAPEPSEALVCIGSDDIPDRIVRGSIAKAPDGTQFTLDRTFERAPFSIGSVYIENSDGFVDITDISNGYDTAFSPFGNKLRGDSCRLYIMISDIDDKRFSDRISLYFETADRCAVRRNPVSCGNYRPRDIIWEYSTAGGFRECTLISDGTCALSFSGTVSLGVSDDFCDYSIDRLPSGRWLRVSLSYCGCEDMPQLKAIYNDMMPLVQKRVHASFQDFVLADGEVVVEDMLAAGGSCFVLIRDAHGWQYIYDAPIQRTACGIRLTLGGYASMAANDGDADVRVIFCTEDFGRSRMFMSSDGLPCQQFYFDADGLVLTSDLRVMVLDREDSKFPRWREYSYIESLDLAGPYDRCFSYDEERGRLIFGDNENGETPPAGNENIMIISCAVTSGAHGNMPADSLSELIVGDARYPVAQYTACSGGRNKESFRHALNRLKASLSECTRAVTADDYRTLAMTTPGLRIADAKAIPFFDPDASMYSGESLANTISVVVLPYSTSRFPMPDSRFLTAVMEHIENFRLITTNVKAISPIYVKIDISADIVCDTREVGQALWHSEAALRSLLSVYGEDGRTRFGEPVGESDIIAKICSVDGILSVKQLNISTEMAGCSRDRYGRLVIPPHAIAYCGNVSLNIAES